MVLFVFFFLSKKISGYDAIRAIYSGNRFGIHYASRTEQFLRKMFGESSGDFGMWLHYSRNDSIERYLFRKRRNHCERRIFCIYCIIRVG